MLVKYFATRLISFNGICLLVYKFTKDWIIKKDWKIFLINQKKNHKKVTMFFFMKNELDLSLDSPTHNGEFFLNSPPQMHMDDHLLNQVLGKSYLKNTKFLKSLVYLILRSC